MATHKIGGSIVLEGEKAYKQALKDIKAAHTELRSEMRLADASFKDNQNSLEALQKKHEILSKQVDVQKDKVRVYEKAIEDSTRKESEAAKKVEDLTEALNSAEKEMSEMKNSSDSTAEAMEDQQKTIEELKKKLELAEQSYDKAAEKTVSYQTSLNLANATLKDMESELTNTETYLKEAEQNTDKCAHSIDKYGKEVNQASEKTSVFGDVLKANLMSEAILSGVRELANGIKDIAESAVETGSSFEASMSQVAATMGMTADEVSNGSEAYTILADAAKNCGKSTMFSASQAGEALNYLALAGYDAEKSAATLPKTLNLAAAGGLDLAYASDLVTDSMAALGLETQELDKYIDEMARTSQKSNTSVAQLGEATLVCAGTVSLTGQSLETMNTELGVLANNGIKGAEGGTHLRNILLSLSTPTDNAAKTINKLGLEVFDSAGNMRDLNDIIVDFNSVTAEMSSEEKTRTISAIFNKTDIAAVNALIKGAGDEFNNLYHEIENSSGAAAAMAETLNSNLKGEVTILHSALEGLGITAYEIFDDELKSSVEAATNAVGRLQRSIESGNLGVSLNKMSDALGKFCENAIDVGEDALPVMIDGLTWLLDNADLVISGVTGIAAANLEMKVVAPAIEAVQMAWNAYKKANEGATVSQWLLNTAMNANPAGIMITAITALTAAVAAYVIINKDNLQYTGEQTQKTRELIEETRALNEEYDKAATERKQISEGFTAQTSAASKLVAELGELRSKTSLTTNEQTRMKMVVSELNELVPDLNLEYDEQNNLLNQTQSEIEGCVDAYMALYKAQAAQEELQDIAQRQVEYEKQLYDITQQRKELEEELAKAEAAKADAAYGVAGATAEYQAAKNAKEALEELSAIEKETIANNEALTEEYAYWIDVISENQPIYDAAEAERTLGEEALAAGEHMTEMSEEMQEALQEMHDSVADALDSQMNLFEEFESGTAVSAEKMLANMQSQIDGVTNWADNMESLADRGINQGLLQTLSEMGPKGAGYVSAFVEMTDEELEKANDLYVEALTLKQNTADEITQDWMKAGNNATEGFRNGFEDGAEAAAQAGADVTQGVLDRMKETLDEHSPSKKTQVIAEDADIGLGKGFEDKKNDVLKIIEGITSEIILTMRDELKASIFIEIGNDIMENLASGITQGKSRVTSAISSAIGSAVQAARDEIDFKAGEMAQYAAKSYEEVSSGAMNSGVSAYSNDENQLASQAQKAIARAAANMQNAVYMQDAQTSSQPTPVKVTVKLVGDAAGLFQVVAEEDDVFYKSTGKGRFDHND